MPVTIHERVRNIFALIDDMQSGKAPWSRFDEMVVPNFVAYVPGQQLDREQFKGVMQAFGSAFSGSSHTLTDVACEGDTAMVREVWSGTQTGAFLGAPPSGKRVESIVFVLLKFEGDKLKEFHEVFDTLGLMRDTGVLNAPAT
jgi:predicted ester cyclase